MTTSSNMIETSAAASCWNCERIEPEQETELHLSDFEYHHHHHHRHQHIHHRYRHHHHYQRVKTVSIAWTFLFQLFVATTIAASSSNPSVSMNILNDHFHVHNTDIRSAEHSMRSQSIDSPKIVLNENRPLPRIVSEKYRNMKIPFVSSRPGDTMAKSTVDQSQSMRHALQPTPPSPLPSPLQSDAAISCYCPHHKFKCMRICSNEKKYTKKSHKRMPYDRPKVSALHVKSSTLIFGSGGGGGGGGSGSGTSNLLRNSNASQPIQRRNHAFSSSEMSAAKFHEKLHIRTSTNNELHKNRTVRSNAHQMDNRNHVMHATQSPSPIAFEANRNFGVNAKKNHASSSNQMDINELLLLVVNADESVVASVMNATTTKHNTKRKTRSTMQNDANTNATKTSTWAIPNRKYNSFDSLSICIFITVSI